MAPGCHDERRPVDQAGHLNSAPLKLCYFKPTLMTSRSGMSS